MAKFYAVMIDETGCEFPAEVEANSHDEAEEELRDMYPESRIDQLESESQARKRERQTYERANRAYEDDYYDDDYYQ